MRIVETTLAPGGGSGMQRCKRNAAVSVVQPGKVKVVETGAPAQSRSRKRRAMPRTSVGSRVGVERDLINVGPSLYRQISVEVK
jgi:hypothetical protein